MTFASSLSPKTAIATAFSQCRTRTLAAFADCDRSLYCAQPHPDFSPIGWHLGHIGFVEHTWLLENGAGDYPSYPTFYRTLYDAASLPKAERRNLPDLEETQEFLAATRSRVLEVLDATDLDERRARLWWWLLQHECQHAETIAFIIQLHSKQATTIQLAPPEAPKPLASELVAVPAGWFEMGSDRHAQDNERPAHRIWLDGFYLDRDLVTCGQYRTFMEAGGYRDRQYWSAAGWQWLQGNPVDRPQYWSADSVWNSHPACGVSYFEAEAYATFAGKRLPTEAEWEKAARWNSEGEVRDFPWGNDLPNTHHCNHGAIVGHTTPVGTYPSGTSAVGCRDLLGNVWEWTATWFSPYKGFEVFPYIGYSATYFDDRHRVLKGGSWATRSWALRASWRNWYEPEMRQMLVGFRCASDA